MFILIGCREEHEYGYGGWTGKVDIISKPVARFTTEKLAIDYVDSSRLKNPSKGRKFRQKSLLAGFEWAEIECPETESWLPCNPEVKVQ